MARKPLSPTKPTSRTRLSRHQEPTLFPFSFSGLCVVTTRYSLRELKAFWQTTAPEVKLLRLSRDGGVHLLYTLGVRGTAQEFATLVEDVKAMRSL